MSQSTKVGIKAQSALGTPATGTVNYLLHTNFTETPGRITDQGEPELGAGLAVFGASAVYGLRPVVTGTGRARVPSLGILLEAAGRLNTAGVYVPVTSAAAALYYTAVADYVTHQKSYVDCKIRRLAINVVPGQAPTFEYTLAGLNVNTTSLTLAAVAGDKMLTPAATILSAQATIAGVAGTNFYSFQYIIENTTLNDRTPIGHIAADDNLTISLATRCVILLANTPTNYEKFVLGAASNIAPTADMQSGALHVRINTAGVTPNYIDFVWTTGEWNATRPIQSRPTTQDLIEVTGTALTGITETIA